MKYIELIKQIHNINNCNNIFVLGCKDKKYDKISLWPCTSTKKYHEYNIPLIVQNHTIKHFLDILSVECTVATYFVNPILNINQHHFSNSITIEIKSIIYITQFYIM